MKNRLLLAILLTLTFSAPVKAQTKLVRSFKEACDSLSVLIKERTTVDVPLKLKTVTRRDAYLDFYFTTSLSDIPWSKKDASWFRTTLQELFPDDQKNLKVGNIFGNNINLNQLTTPVLHYDGQVHDSEYRKVNPQGNLIVEEVGAPKFEKGLSGRHIALWHSHGRYYETKTSRWEWQRAQTFTTVEDMYTQSYVLPFLMPMLENAGAYVMSPRERDTQPYEAVVDNDAMFEAIRGGKLRRSGKYEESGSWKSAGTGFADKKQVYVLNDNPFTMGTVRQTTAYAKNNKEASAKWTPDIPARGRYAVYISYKTLPNSTEHAHYTVRHLGGESEFSVNQKMGGGTWIYLGTFEFDNDGSGYVMLDNMPAGGATDSASSVITADGVRFGGGMGKIARGTEEVPVEEWETSGMPSYMEGALYAMQWAGVDTTITRKHPDDYTNDFADRGPWTYMMSGGSRVNPKESGKGIPFDLSLAFHSDAGVFPNDSIIGTLSIYTLKADGSRKLPDGGDRMICRDLCNYVQSQVVGDIRTKYEPEWARREIWDRSYSEARTSGVPGMILELLSHQNFADMKYGLDPAFRFDVSRAVYKGVLKFLSDRYGCRYEVQPLPVHSFSAVLKGSSKVSLSWVPTADPIEPTAVSRGFILYTRVDDGAFDRGRTIEADENDGRYSTEVEIEPGHIYSYRIVAFNDGGKSFPSETLSAGVPDGSSAKKVLVVNNFTRVSAPAWFDTPEYAGFDPKLDSGVPYMNDIAFIGDMYQFRRELEWIDDDNPGFGGSYTDQAGRKTAGNTFDYPYIHGKAILKAGYAFGSMGSDAFSADSTLSRGFWACDIICGKQITTAMGRGGAVPDRYQVFPEDFQKAIRNYTSNGGNILISGSNIGTDVWDQIYPVSTDAIVRSRTKRFVEDILGYTWLTNYASRSGMLWKMNAKQIDTAPLTSRFGFWNEPNETSYCVETPDGIVPSDKNGSTFLRYTDTNISAAVCCDKKEYRTVSLGFPLEVLKDEKDLCILMNVSLSYLEGK